MGYAQAPQGINYQGVARDNAGNALSITNISLEFKIWQGDPNSGGSIIYSEVYASVTTDTFGLYSLVTGKGTQTSSQAFNQIPWASGNMWVQIYIDPAGGSAFNLIATQQLMSVPYALYAEKSGSSTGSAPPGVVGQIQYHDAAKWDSTSAVLIDPSKNIVIAKKLGVNTSTPNFTNFDLDVNGIGYFSTGILTGGLVIPLGSATGKVLTSDNLGNATWQVIPGSGSSPWTSSGGLIFTTNPNDILVGIGTNTPQTTLDIFSNDSNGALNVSYNSISNSPAIDFQIQNASNGSAVLEVVTFGSGEAISATATSGPALWVQNTSSGASTIDAENLGGHTAGFFHNGINGVDPTLVAINNGNGNAGTFSISNPSNDSTALIAYTNGKGAAVAGYSEGLGDAGVFVINNPASSATGLVGFTNGSGKSILGLNTGTGYAGAFWVSNPVNDSAAIIAVTNGKSSAGVFQINNNANSFPALSSRTNGSGKAIEANSTTGHAISATATSGSALIASNTGGGHTVSSINFGQVGSAGNFQISNNTNTNPALQASTNGGGPGIQTDKIRITATGPQPGFVLSSANVSGDAQWTPIAGATNFAINTSVTTQTFAASSNVVINLATSATYTNGGAAFSGNSFVAPTGGIYHFDVQISVSNVTVLSGGTLTLVMWDPGALTIYKETQMMVPTAGTYTQPFSISTDLNLAPGQKVELRLSNTATGTNYRINTGPTISWFNGHKIF